MSIFFLAAIIVGGMGSILGAILGAVFMTMVPEFLKLVVGWLPVGGDGSAGRARGPGGRGSGDRRLDP